MYMPRFNHRDGRKRDYIRGFGCQFWYTGAQTDLSYAKTLPGFGADFKKAVKERYPALLNLHPFGESIPKAENRITVKGSPVDQYGTPIARINYAIGENERRMSKDMYDTMLEILHAAKAEIVPYQHRLSGAQRKRHPRARHLPHGSRPEAFRPKRIQPNARREERLRRRWLGLHDGLRKEPDDHDSRASLAIHRLHGRGNKARKYLVRRFALLAAMLLGGVAGATSTDASHTVTLTGDAPRFNPSRSQNRNPTDKAQHPQARPVPVNGDILSYWRYGLNLAMNPKTGAVHE